jgi:hypothetical protein
MDDNNESTYVKYIGTMNILKVYLDIWKHDKQQA